MKGRDRHVPPERLTALALAARTAETAAAESVHDRQAFEHVSHCERCAAEFQRLTSEADAIRQLAFAQADEVFDEAMLDAQRTRILDRLAHVGQAARVLSFPRTPREAARASASPSRRWISVAAAAGLIIGLVAGQLLHFVPGTAPPATVRVDQPPVQRADRQTTPRVRPTNASFPLLSGDELMEEVEASVHRRGAPALVALDGLTPTAADALAMGR